MPSGFLDLFLTILVRVLTVIFFIGATGSAMVIVFTAFDILSDIFTPEVPAMLQIDADKRAA